MNHYRVEWHVDISADSSAEAAHEAYQTMNGTDMGHPIFTVICENGDSHIIDMEDIYIEPREEDGDLILYVYGGDPAYVLEYMFESHGDEVDILSTLLEDYWSNGQYFPFAAGDGNPFVGLSSAPCIARELDTDDQGQNTIVDGVYWYRPDYMTDSIIDHYRKTGTIVYKRAP